VPDRIWDDEPQLHTEAEAERERHQVAALEVADARPPKFSDEALALRFAAKFGDAAAYVAPTRVFAPAPPDLEGVKVARGDYVEAQLAERMDKPTLVGDVVTHWLRHAERRRTVVFATSVSHSVHIRDEFARAGIAAEHLDGSTPIDERDDILARLSSGVIDLVTNCGVLCEGWDAPSVGCVVLARPTKSLGLYRQMCGRISRPHPGKTDAVVLDHAGSTWAHGFIDDDIAWSLRDDRRAENKAHAARGAQKAGALVSCPECSAARFQGQPCPACGWRPRAGAEPIEVIDGDLAQIERKGIKKKVWSLAERRRFHSQLVYIADERGYQNGWHQHKYFERFGQWPRGFIEPIPPDPETRSWVKSRQIAYSKAREKAGAV
jgi:superfamily II DNA or RNA helicase